MDETKRSYRALMGVSPRQQYLYGRVTVDVVGEQLRDAPRELASPVVDVASTASSHPDLRQAEYYQQVLEDLRAALNDELSHHCAARAAHERNGNAAGVRRAERIIRAKEFELATIDQLSEALSTRFPTSRIDCHDVEELDNLVSQSVGGGQPSGWPPK